MNRMRQHDNIGPVASLIEDIFMRLDNLLGDSVKKEAYDGLAEKRNQFSGLAYLDQIEKMRFILVKRRD